MFWFYFVRPVQRVLEGWQVKLPLAMILAYFWDLAEHMAGVYTELLSLPSFLWGVATLAFFGDFLTAVLAAYQDEGLAGLKLIKFRQLLIKAAYWLIIISVFSGFATAGEKAGYPVIPNFDAAIVFWLTAQDLWSAVQNWKGKSEAKEWFRGAVDFAQGDISLDQITSDDLS